MRTLLFASYGLAAYALSAGASLALVAFLFNGPVVRGIDGGRTAAWPLALAIDAALLASFAVQHSAMARPAFKRAWARIVPPPLERSTFVLFASLALALLVWQWRAIPAPVFWDLSGSPAGVVLSGVSLAGWGLVVASSFFLDHFEMFGLRQSLPATWQRRPLDATFRTPALYRHVRHPIYLGFLLAFWATPAMTAGHLLFAAGMSAYIFAGIWFEERDLLDRFGAPYRAWRERVGMLLPRRQRGGGQ